MSKTNYSIAPPSYATRLGLFLLIIACAIHIYFILDFNFTQDDAYISFRYAANYLDGQGLVYNGGERVEGYTNFLWTVFMIIGGMAGFDFVIFSRILGMIFGLGTILLAYQFAVCLFRGRYKSIAAGGVVLLLATAQSFAYWSVAGLETAAFTFMTLASLHAYFRKSYVVVVPLVIDTLLRPEGALVFSFIIIYDIIVRRRLSRSMTFIIVSYIIFLAPWAVFKIAYYHSLLPNPFYAKTAMSLQQVSHGADYVWRYLWHYLVGGIALTPAIFAIGKRNTRLMFLYWFVGIYMLYILLVGGDVLKVHRFFVPLMPIVAIIVVYGAVTVLHQRFVWMVFVAGLIAWQTIIPGKFIHTMRDREVGLANKMDHLMSNLLANDTSDFSLAVSTIGLVGYRLRGHTVIDLLGLTDSTIARHPEANIDGITSTWRESNYNSPYVLYRQPDYILFSTGMKPSAPAERALYLYSAFLTSYRTVGFYFSGNVHPIYKRVVPIRGDVRRDVPVQFVEAFNKGINRLWSAKDYPGALKSLDQAIELCPVKDFAYPWYYKHIVYNKMGMPKESYMALRTMISLDTLAYEGYLNLCLMEAQIGNREASSFYYRKTIEKLPWYRPRLDSLLSRR